MFSYRSVSTKGKAGHLYTHAHKQTHGLTNTRTDKHTHIHVHVCTRIYTSTTHTHYIHVHTRARTLPTRSLARAHTHTQAPTFNNKTCTQEHISISLDSRRTHLHTHTTPLTMLSSSTGGFRSPLRPSTMSATSYLPTTAVPTPPCPRAGFIPPRLPGLSAPAHTDLPSPQTRNIKYFPALPFSIFRLATARCCGGRRATAAGSGPADQRNIFDMSPPPIHSSQHSRCLSAFLRRKEKSVSVSARFKFVHFRL